MRYKLLLPIFVTFSLLLAPPTQALTTNSTCQGKSLVTTTTLDTGAVQTETKNCQYGCSNGVCLEPNTAISLMQTSFFFLFILLLSPVILMYYYGRLDYPIFYALLFIIITLLFAVVGIMEFIVGISYSSLTFALAVISSFFAAFFSLIIIKAWLDGKKNYGGDVFDNEI